MAYSVFEGEGSKPPDTYLKGAGYCFYLFQSDPMTNKEKKQLRKIYNELSQLNIKAPWLNNLSQEDQLQWFRDVCRVSQEDALERHHIIDLKSRLEKPVNRAINRSKKSAPDVDGAELQALLEMWPINMRIPATPLDYNPLRNVLGSFINEHNILEKQKQVLTIDRLYPNMEGICKILGTSSNGTQNNKGGTGKTGKKEYSFDINKTKKWFHELYKKNDYQRTGGKPNIGKITQEIIKRHQKDTDSDGKPSEETIKSHRRKLGLMQYDFED